MANGSMLLMMLNGVFIAVMVAAVLWLSVANNCSSFHPMPTKEELANVNVDEAFSIVYAMNILTNVVIAIPGLMLIFMGLPFEGSVLLLTAIFSIMWHASGEQIWATLDWIFASLAAVVMLLSFLRIVQIRGWPEFTAFWAVMPLLGILCWGAVDTEGDTGYLKGRIAHMLWHVLTGATFVIIAIELMRTPALIPNIRLRNAAMRKDMRMWARAEKWGIDHDPSPSLVYGLFKNLVQHGLEQTDAPRFT